jgi:Acyl-CoA synthetases (AMP-forming)/AMP-acid ligases II
VITYNSLLEKYYYWKEKIHSENINGGSVVIVIADFSPNSIALFLALIDTNSIFVPVTHSLEPNLDDIIKISQCEYIIRIDKKDEYSISKLKSNTQHTLYKILRERQHPGLVLFSSGSTGERKASVHDLINILNKFKLKRHAYRTISFLLYDHIGGVNTLLYTLSNAGLLVMVKSRTPDEVLKIVEKYQIELLPTSPTFINLILLSEVYDNYDISSLKLLTYGTETMPESTLKKFNKLFPDIKLLQTYGLSEVGILRSKSKSSSSLWV